MRILRLHRGNFDAWRAYKVEIDGHKHYRLHDGEMLEMPGNTHRLYVSVGPYSSVATSYLLLPDEVIVCEMAANPKRERPGIRLRIAKEKDVQQEVLRFDGPPYSSGNTRMGVARALVATALAGIVGTGILGWNVVEMYFHPSIVPISGPLTLFASSSFLFMSASGVRAFVYYVRLPNSWRH